MNTATDDGRRLLQISSAIEQPFQVFRSGARTRAVLATKAGVGHRLSQRYDQVLVKLYKGDGRS